MNTGVSFLALSLAAVFFVSGISTHPPVRKVESTGRISLRASDAIPAEANAAVPEEDVPSKARRGIEPAEKAIAPLAVVGLKEPEIAEVLPSTGIRGGNKDDTLTFPEHPSKTTEKPGNGTGVEHFFFISGKH